MAIPWRGRWCLRSGPRPELGAPRRQARWPRWVAFAMVGVGVSPGTGGHGATASPQRLPRLSLFLHGVAVAYWVGALVPLAVMARRRHDGLPRSLKQFSAAAIPLVGLLVLSGL